MFGGNDDEAEENEAGEDRKEEIDRILSKYDQRFEEELGGGEGRVESREYQAYKEAERIQRRKTWYEKLVNRLSYFSFNFDDLRQEHRDAILLLDYDIEPGQIVPSAFIVGLVTALLVIPTLLLDIPTLFKVMFASFPFAAFYYLLKYPSLKARQKVVESSEELILAVLYMVISMRSSPNLEGAISFAARHLQGPVSKDLKLVLWRLDVREYTTVNEALADYVSRWRPYNKGFVEALNLMKSATAEASPEKRNEVLTEAIDTLLDDTRDRMDSFARNLKLPVMAIHGIGILMPVLGIILFPMIAAFMGGEGMILYLAFLYNILIPLMVYVIMKNLLVSRPLSLSSRTGRLSEADPGRMTVSVLGKEFEFNAFLLSIPLFLVLAAWPASHYYGALTGGGIPVAPSTLTLFQELMIVVAAAIPIGIHLTGGYREVVEKQNKIRSMEEEFPEALFELAKALDRGQPVELAVGDAAQEEKRMDISDMFSVLSLNMRERSMTFEEALFDPDMGALRTYPSRLMQTVMEVIVESTEKGTRVAARAIESISDYLKNIKETQKMMQNLLEDTLSSILFLGYVLAPVISGVAVGMGAVITLSFNTIAGVAEGVNPGNVSAGGGEVPGGGLGSGGGGILDIFGFQDIIAPGILQLVVGIYLIQISILIGTLYVQLAEGKNPARRNLMIGKLLLTTIPFYTIVVLIIYVVFGGIVRGAIV